MQEFEVRIKDKQQDIVHRVRQMAKTKRQANMRFLRYLRKAMGHNEFEIL